jgi:hypothetical protein
MECNFARNNFRKTSSNFFFSEAMRTSRAVANGSVRLSMSMFDDVVTP